MKKIRVGVLGAIGMVGQQYAHLLSNHPYNDRPQPRQDRGSGKGMSVTVGRLRKCPLFEPFCGPVS